MKKKKLYTAVILLSFLAIGIQPTFAIVHTLEPGIPTYFGAWSEEDTLFTFHSNPNVGDSIQIINQLNAVLIIDGDGHAINLNGSADTGVYLDYSSDVTIMNLNITGCGEGIELFHSSYVNVENNSVTDCEWGIRLVAAGTCTIKGNIVSNNDTGIFLGSAWVDNTLFHSVNNDLYNNAIRNNNYGISISETPAPGYYNEIFNNNFINNAGAHAEVVDSDPTANVFSNNYWDDWSGSGSYVFDGGQDDFPLAVPLPLSPQAMIERLIDKVEIVNGENGISNALDAKLDAAFKALDDLNQKNDVAAINALNAFINAVEAQSGDKIDADVADELIADAQYIINLILTE